MKLIAHDCFERGEDFITRTMAGEELGITHASMALLSAA